MRDVWQGSALDRQQNPRSSCINIRSSEKDFITLARRAVTSSSGPCAQLGTRHVHTPRYHWLLPYTYNCLNGSAYFNRFSVKRASWCDRTQMDTIPAWLDFTECPSDANDFDYPHDANDTHHPEETKLHPNFQEEAELRGVAACYSCIIHSLGYSNILCYFITYARHIIEWSVLNSSLQLYVYNDVIWISNISVYIIIRVHACLKRYTTCLCYIYSMF